MVEGGGGSASARVLTLLTPLTTLRSAITRARERQRDRAGEEQVRVSALFPLLLPVEASRATRQAAPLRARAIGCARRVSVKSGEQRASKARDRNKENDIPAIIEPPVAGLCDCVRRRARRNCVHVREEWVGFTSICSGVSGRVEERQLKGRCCRRQRARDEAAALVAAGTKATKRRDPAYPGVQTTLYSHSLAYVLSSRLTS